MYLNNDKYTLMREKMKRTRRTDIPDIDLARAVDYAGRIAKKGKIILREDLENLINKHGGTLNGIIKSLKDYRLINRTGQAEFTLTDIGVKIAKSRQSNDIFDVFLSIPIFSKIYKKYERDIPSIKVLSRYLKGSMSDADAKKVAGLYVRSLKPILPNLPVKFEIEGKREPSKGTATVISLLDNNTYETIKIFGYLFPDKSIENVKEALNKLVQLTEKNEGGFRESRGILKGLRIAYGDKDDKEVKEELKEKADQVIEAFEKDLGVKKEKVPKKVEEE